ncbi:MAG: threonine/serine exporter family protein [Clostridium sp.]|nr:threonine/serine exporter family protein [Clostridium sp.]
MLDFTFICRTLEDALFAAIAGTGFAIISNPPLRTLAASALLAAIGHSLRFMLMNAFGLPICPATFMASFSIGFLAMFFARRQGVSVEVYAFPSLLPMIPGLYAYRAIQSLAYYMNAEDEASALQYINLFFHNFLTASFVLFLLVAGIVLPMFALKNILFSANRKKYVS